MSAFCTLITATNPATITKEFSLKPDGTLDRKTTAHVTAAQMKIVRFKNIQEFSNLLKNLETNQCLMYGVPPCSPVDLVTEEEWVKAGRPVSQIARTRKTMNWPARPGVLMLDYDAPKDGKPAYTQEELIRIFLRLVPDFIYLTFSGVPVRHLVSGMLIRS